MAGSSIETSLRNRACLSGEICAESADEKMMHWCGWKQRNQIPHASTFSRAFPEFSAMRLLEGVHEQLIRDAHQNRIVGHISRDSSNIRGRERFPETPSQKRTRVAEEQKSRTNTKQKVSAEGRKLGRKLRKRKRTASPGETRMKRQVMMTSAAEMLQDISREYGVAVRMTQRRDPKFCRAYKLHLDVTDGQIPVTAVLTGAKSTTRSCPFHGLPSPASVSLLCISDGLGL